MAVISNAQNADSLKLPFAIAKEKRLPEEDLANKKEGCYVTGVPDLSSDPVNGFGYGGEGSLFFNGKRSDPFFAYTPYRAKLDLVLFNTTRKQREAMLRLDIPYVFNTKWRLRLEGGYESNPNLLYFGTTEKTLNGLSYFQDSDSSKTRVTNASYQDYEKHGLVGDNRFYNTYIKEEYILNVSGERSFLDGKLRTLVGYEIAQVGITTFAGNSMLQSDFAQHKILGVGKNTVGIIQVGLIYDTRDLETDPSQGIFAELTNELSMKKLGSAFDFNKTFFHANLYQNLLPKRVKKLVLALRIAGGYTQGNSPFFEYQDQWSSEGSIEGLGGAHTLRGYKQARFLGRVMTFNNLELRYRFAQAKILKQHLAFAAVPFADAGGVWDELSRVGNFNNYRVSEGMGLRIIWNVNTVLRFDYAVSQEDRQFFFNLSHTF
ncbi:MAG: BamA/TamA family outer membrane protein [Bacteroidetes bacterium]|nr:BamA/TamA family outer membrane protein [Bacteroidota bacterium]